MVLFIWGRFILMLQLTKSFGPIIRIIIVMIGEVLKFLFIWSIVLVAISSIASLLFGELPEFEVFTDVLFACFGMSMGNYEYGIFEDLSLGANIGKFFIIVSVIINTVVLMNFIIAILSDTYSKLSTQSLGIYYDGIIARIPIYEYNPRYGGLIVGTPPFNVLAILMIPVYLLVKDQETLTNINDKFTRVLYLPLAIFFTAIFTALNLLIVPIAYLAALMKKMKLAKTRNERLKS